MAFLSHGVENVIHCLSAYNRPVGSGCFPDNKYKNADTRFGKKESLHSWFSRCTDATGGVARWCIEDNIGIFGVTKWTNGHMTYLNIQAIVAEQGTLEEFYSDKSAAKCHYTRLDLDFTTVGSLFKEPLPHIHTYPNDPPWLSFAPGCERVLVTKFLEFLYLNYAHDKWLKWVREVWKTRNSLDGDKDPLESVIQAYNASKSEVLVQRYDKVISKLRTVLAGECERVSRNLAIISPNVKILSY